jgi:hypothetical protein
MGEMQTTQAEAYATGTRTRNLLPRQRNALHLKCSASLLVKRCTMNENGAVAMSPASLSSESAVAGLRSPGVSELQTDG